MLCENCKQREASVHSVTIINGLKKEHYLCAECAKGVQFSLPSLMDILNGFHVDSLQEPLEQCKCGCSYLNFQKTGLLGCPACYATYGQRLTPVIKRAQGGKIHHVGRIPQRIQKDERSEVLQSTGSKMQIEQDERKRLRFELHKAVEEERYERAAELRDRLRALEGEGII